MDASSLPTRDQGETPVPPHRASDELSALDILDRMDRKLGAIDAKLDHLTGRLSAVEAESATNKSQIRLALGALMTILTAVTVGALNHLGLGPKS